MSIAREDKFERFRVSTHAYKSVDGHPILLDIFIPKKLTEAGPSAEEWQVKRPVMLFFHAGWLVGGQREFQPWWSRWILDLMVKHGAIGITADHRLIPEATCEDVLDDIHDVWEWVHKDLDQTLQKEYPGIWSDPGRLLLAGSSAGGYCAFQLGLSYYETTNDQSGPFNPSPRAILVLYPYVSIRTPFWTTAYTKHISRAPQFPASLLDEHLASIADARAKTRKQPIVTSVPMLDSEGNFTERAHLAICATQHGRILELFGAERDSSPGKRRMHPEDRIIDGHKLPPTVIVQGTDDSISPVGGCDIFVQNLQKHSAVGGLAQGREEGEVLRYVRVPGGHLFETELGLDEGTEEWVKDAALFIEKHWLR